MILRKVRAETNMAATNITIRTAVHIMTATSVSSTIAVLIAATLRTSSPQTPNHPDATPSTAGGMSGTSPRPSSPFRHRRSRSLGGLGFKEFRV